jgi:NAD(P)-dependent dehydrogenase (short-subunit alcohol dehydrogenase family)
MYRKEELIVVVTGSSRGIGRGIARSLGALGATVYVTGRSHANNTSVFIDEMPLPGTIEEAAAEVTAAGGRGVPVVCDLAKDEQIRNLFDLVRRDSGRVDILVNNAAFLHNAMGTPGPFWTRPVEMANIIDVGLRCHFVATYYAAPLMVAGGKGLVVNISFFGDSGMHEPSYYAAKAGLDKLAAAVAMDFRPFGVAAVSLWPGIVATERLHSIAAQMPVLKERLPSFESPDFSGLVIAALYRDPEMMSLSGKTLISAELAARYGVKDIDGKQPASHRGVYGVPHKAFDIN